MATATKPQGKPALCGNDPLPREMVKWLVQASDSASIVAQQHAALLAADSRFSGPHTVRAAGMAFRCLDFPPAIPLGGNIAFRSAEIAFPSRLSVAVRRLVAALEPYRAVAKFVGGCVPSMATFAQRDASATQRELVKAAASVLECLSAPEVAAARDELAALEREQQRESQRTMEERAARWRKERAANGGTPGLYRNSKMRYTVGATGQTNEQKPADDGPPAAMNGPVEPQTFVWNEQPHKMRPQLFRLLKSLWDARDRKRSTNHIIEAVWFDCEPSEKTVANLPGKLTEWFDEHKLPFSCESAAGWFTLSQHPERHS